jgi:hypothetical protein
VILLKNANSSPPPEEEPPRGSSDLALFDQCRVTNAPRLFDGDLPDHVEERFERHPYTLSRNRRPRPFRGPAGEVVRRYRGGNGYTPIYEAWRPERLLRVRGRLMAALVPTEGGGRAVSWVDHPRGWSAIEPNLPAPYVLRQMMPVSNGVDAFEENTVGPTIETDEWLVPRRTAKDARQIYLLELKEAWTKAIAWSHRVITSEYRNPDHGEYGPQSRQATERAGLTFSERGSRTSGVNRQKAVAAPSNKPGPKPEHGFSLDARLRKIKSRCKKRGVPFILARYLKPKKEPEHEHSS